MHIYKSIFAQFRLGRKDHFDIISIKYNWQLKMYIPWQNTIKNNIYNICNMYILNSNPAQQQVVCPDINSLIEGIFTF